VSLIKDVNKKRWGGTGGAKKQLEQGETHVNGQWLTETHLGSTLALGWFYSGLSSSGWELSKTEKGRARLHCMYFTDI
jgi:hypothetical protein